MVEFDDNLNPLEPQPSGQTQPSHFQSQPTAPMQPPSAPQPSPLPNTGIKLPMRGSGFMFGGVLILLLIVLALAVALYITRTPAGNNTTPPISGQPEGLNVSGQATVFATPDIAKVTVGVTKNGKTVAEVKDALAKVTSDVTDAVTDLDVDEKDIKTANLSVYPQYTSNGRTITGYSGQHSLTITVRDLDTVDKVTDAATKAGANELQGVIFTVSDPEKWWKDARSEALAQAKDKAKQIAKDADIRLGRLLSINEWSNQPWDGGYGGGPIAYTKEGMSTDMAINTSPGSLELTVNVSLVYRID